MKSQREVSFAFPLQGSSLLKRTTEAAKPARNWGFRRLFYYESRVPNVYDGDLRAEEEVLEVIMH